MAKQKLNNAGFFSPSGTEFAMFSRIVFIVFALNFIFCGTGMMPNFGSLGPAMKCYKGAGFTALAVLEAMGARPDTDADKLKLTCLTLGVSLYS